ncbi:MAG: PorV/PorQ family protein [Bacteroidota bacterium]
MKNRVIYVTILFCVALALVLNTAEAQNKRLGTGAATELLIPIGARDLAMGGSTIATSEGVEAIYWNPAGLGRMSRGAEGMFSQMSYIADIGVSYGAVAGKFGEFGVLGLSVKSLSFGDIPLTTVDDPEGDGGKTFSPTFFTLGLTYSRQLTDAISAGTNLKIVSETIDRVSSGGIAFDFGIQYRGLVGVQGLQLGVAVKNIGPQMKFDGSGLLRAAVATEGDRPEQQYKSEAASFELPSTIEIGLAYRSQAGENAIWSLNGAFTNDNLYQDEYRVGGELGIKMDAISLFGRAGVGMVPQASDDNIFGASFGVGFTYDTKDLGITVDYAYRSVKFFDANNVISLKLGF